MHPGEGKVVCLLRLVHSLWLKQQKSKIVMTEDKPICTQAEKSKSQISLKKQMEMPFFALCITQIHI